MIPRRAKLKRLSIAYRTTLIETQIKTKPVSGRPLTTLEDLKQELLKSGKITQKGLDEARRVLDADPEIQAARRGESLHVLS